MQKPLICLALALSSVSGIYLSAQQDKYLYLEEPTSDRAMAWVKTENARTAKVLEADPRFAAYQADALKVAEDPNRLAIPALRGDPMRAGEPAWDAALTIAEETRYACLSRPLISTPPARVSS